MESALSNTTAIFLHFKNPQVRQFQSMQEFIDVNVNLALSLTSFLCSAFFSVSEVCPTEVPAGLSQLWISHSHIPATTERRRERQAMVYRTSLFSRKENSLQQSPRRLPFTLIGENWVICSPQNEPLVKVNRSTLIAQLKVYPLPFEEVMPLLKILLPT